MQEQKPPAAPLAAPVTLSHAGKIHETFYIEYVFTIDPWWFKCTSLSTMSFLGQIMTVGSKSENHCNGSGGFSSSAESWSLVIELGLFKWTSRQKMLFFGQIIPGNDPSDTSAYPVKRCKSLKFVGRDPLLCTKLVISVWTSIYGYPSGLVCRKCCFSYK